MADPAEAAEADVDQPASLLTGRLEASRLGVLIVIEDRTRVATIERHLSQSRGEVAMMRQLVDAMLASRSAPPPPPQAAAVLGSPTELPPRSAVLRHLVARLQCGLDAATQAAPLPTVTTPTPPMTTPTMTMPPMTTPTMTATYHDHAYRGLDAATQAEYLAACASLLGAEAEPTTGAAAGEAGAEEAASEAVRVEEWRDALRKLAPPSAGEGPWPSRPEELLGAEVVAGGGGGVGLLEWRLDLREGPDEPQLLLLALRLFTASGVAAAFSLEPQQLLGCLVELRGTYLPNSFHNWRHAMM
eukprot:scaffold982_cov42-Phaeocystis_antarctica.AAC.4